MPGSWSSSCSGRGPRSLPVCWRSDSSSGGFSRIWISLGPEFRAPGGTAGSFLPVASARRRSKLQLRFRLGTRRSVRSLEAKLKRRSGACGSDRQEGARPFRRRSSEFRTEEIQIKLNPPHWMKNRCISYQVRTGSSYRATTAAPAVGGCRTAHRFVLGRKHVQPSANDKQEVEPALNESGAGSRGVGEAPGGCW